MQGVECYKHMTDDVDFTTLVITHSPLIKKIANHIKCKLPSYIELDDLIQAGLIGLLAAQKKFDADKGASFATYAAIKIRAAMIDDLRINTGITRQISDNIKKISQAKAKLENSESQEMISSQGIADELGISFGKYSDIMSEINAYKSISTSEGAEMDDLALDELQNPSIQVEREDIRSAIKAVIRELPWREQQILALYYNEQLNFKEIAEILDLTEARISQIHVLALAKVKKKYQYAHGVV